MASDESSAASRMKAAAPDLANGSIESSTSKVLAEEVEDKVDDLTLDEPQEAAKKKKKKSKSKKKKEPPQQTDPPSIPVVELFPSGEFPEGEIQQYKDEMGELMVEKHVKYILTIEKKKDDFASVVMEHLRLNGAYWGLTTLDVLGKLDAVDQYEVIPWIMQCQHESGGFGGNIGHDPHLLYTLSAIQVLALFDKICVLDIEKVANYITNLQNEDGSFSGDIWGEIDTRFSYIALCSLALLQRLDKINVGRAVEYIVSCKNLDGGFGCTPGAESHAGQIFCCVGALAITGSLHHVDKDLLGWWLCERQVKSGGLNGRPEKLPDVCYSWWVLSSLIMIDRVHWIDKKKLVNFILDCQDKENGGISDRPDDVVDVFHTYFGVAGLSLLEYSGLKAIDPAYALPVDVVNRIFLNK